MLPGQEVWNVSFAALAAAGHVPAVTLLAHKLDAGLVLRGLESYLKATYVTATPERLLEGLQIASTASWDRQRTCCWMQQQHCCHSPVCV
ncbi:carboxymuconolactone decarboxylase [Micractinium conductrix]|uniref:Carboxymuconolactone decarboxylase n=1 Tax=Micractinium conductrix TaxID=554055 RepID=A0A2P6UZF9_9CHLO|nr:carboxymuconolactone decarboxylase [Micractinium conductrix]|eukprot:PSC67227.1 carboxymuconolactone decarboxylase [Micractinium conductrix]